MNLTQISDLISNSLLEIFYRDELLFKRRVREECINHRLAFYLETFLEKILVDEMNYNVDLEYNKNIGIDYKIIEVNINTRLRIRPDVIIHKRDDNNSNLLAIEAKLETLTKHDFQKLRKLLYPPFDYKYSTGLSYYPDRDYFEYHLFWVFNGEVKNELIKIDKK